MTDEPIWTIRLYKGNINVARSLVAMPNGAQPADIRSLNVSITVRKQMRVPVGTSVTALSDANDAEPFYGVDRGVAYPTQRNFYGVDLGTEVWHRFVPWEDLPAIAAWVRGDGTDPQRQALADGILEGAHTGKPSWW